MPSFDIISEFDIHEAKNAVDQANKEVTTRFDFKGTDSNFDINDTTIVMESQSTFQLQQMFSVLCSKLTKRGTDERTVALAGRMICASLSLERWNEYLDGIGCGRLSFVDHNHDSNQFDRREGVWISDPMTAVWNLSMMFICVPHELVEKILVLGGLP